MSARFGPAGNAADFPYKTSAQAPGWLRELGLDCYEYQCGKGVHVGEDTARRIGAAAREHGITLSLHAPYFINLANPDPAALQKTIGYITDACLTASRMGAGRVIIHSGALMGRTRRQALDIALRSLREVLRACDDAGFGALTLCPETMGKINQLGDLDEVLELCALDERLVPCVDFGHLYARSLGADDGEEAMERMENSGYTALPILDAEGHYKGVITEGDLLWAFKRLCVMDIRQTEEHSITEIAAPRRAVQPVRVDTRVEDLIAVAADQNFVPVVDDKDDFIGIVTRSRILKYCLEQYFVATVY